MIFSRAIATTVLYVSILASLGSTQANARELSGRARAVDGDTLMLGATTIRLDAIDAPETDQICLDAKGRRWSCGLIARDRLARRIRGEIVTCTGDETDPYGRRLASCRAGATDLQRWMVRAGLALSFVAYSHRYDADEAEARRSQTGLWSGAFVTPWDWRKRSAETQILGTLQPGAAGADALRGLDGAQRPPVASCLVKGNVSRKGQRIYHLPGMRDYTRTRIDRAAGERWFCSAREAEAAGWRRAAR